MSYLLDPDAVLDFQFDWSAKGWLATGETIDSHQIITTAGITVASSSEADGVVTVWLTDGTVGTTQRVTCRIVTDQGRTDDRSISVRVVER